MKKTQSKNVVDPYHRYLEAKDILDSGVSTSQTKDVWVDKLVNILKLREAFREKYSVSYMREFSNKFPLYANLLQSFEDTRTGGDRDILEAGLLASLDCVKVAECLNTPRFNSLFLSLYRELFYDIRKILKSSSQLFQYIIQPITQADSDKIAIGHIWKLLALTGGTEALKKKGFEADAIKAEDLAYLLQIASFRNCSMILQYSASGKSFFLDNPGAGTALNALADFDGIRGAGRRTDYLAEVSAIAKNNFSSLLKSELVLKNIPEKVVAQLSELDGSFFPENSDVFEKINHITCIDTVGEINE